VAGPLPSAAHHLSPAFELDLTEVAPGGDAVGRRDDGLVVFVPGGVPGDRVAVRLLSRQRSYARGELLRVVSPGPERVEAACPLAMPQPGQTAAACGGCPLMALSRPAQLVAKQSWVARALRQLAVELRPILAPAEPLGYRLRARLVVRAGQLSFAAAASHRGAVLTACPVLAPELAQVLLSRGPELPAALGEGGALSGLLGWHAGRPAVQLAAELGRHGHLPVVRRLLQKWIEAGDIVGASLRSAAGQSAAQEEILGQATLDLAAPPGEVASRDDLGPLAGSAAGFAQACAAGHTLLPKLVADAVRLPFVDGSLPVLPQPQVLELFSGSGNLTRALLPLAQAITCVEGDPAAMARAAARFGDAITRCAEPVDSALAKLSAAGARFSTVVLDPPRAGAREAMSRIVGLGAQRVIYVSCDVMTLARDLATLAAAGYRLRSVQPLDLMPHTAEIECIAVCDREPLS